MMTIKKTDLVHVSELLLQILIAEESSEIGHAAAKCIRFGGNGSHPDWKDGQINDNALLDEFAQLYHTMCTYCAKRGLNFGYELAQRPKREIWRLDKYEIREDDTGQG